jgi:hypothetical protein
VAADSSDLAVAVRVVMGVLDTGQGQNLNRASDMLARPSSSSYVARRRRMLASESRRGTWLRRPRQRRRAAGLRTDPLAIANQKARQPGPDAENSGSVLEQEMGTEGQSLRWLIVSAQSSTRNGEVRVNAPVGSTGVTCCSRELREVEGQQVGDIGIRCTLRQFGEHVHEVCVGFDFAGPTREHQAVDHCARFRSGNRVTEQP